MLKARATTLGLGIALVFLTAIGTASPARADRGFGFHHHPFFFHNHFFFRDRFFFGFPGFGFPVGYPWPAVDDYPPAYYPPAYYSPAYYPPAYYPPPPVYRAPPNYAPPSDYPPPPGATGASSPTYPRVAEGTPPPQGAAPGNCRKIQQPIKLLDGRSVMAYATTCQQPDGSTDLRAGDSPSRF
jgi:hypothetical protein